MDEYRINVVNETDELWDICLFQRPSDPTDPQNLTLAWKVAPLAGHSRLTVPFTVERSFHVGQQETPGGGPARFSEAQDFPADPHESRCATGEIPGNVVGLTWDEAYGLVTFSGTARPADLPGGSLSIRPDGSVPDRQALAGIGVGGSPVTVRPVRPDRTEIFTHRLNVWILAGRGVEQGQIIGAEIPAARELDLDGHREVTVAFGPDHSWAQVQHAC